MRKEAQFGIFQKYANPKLRKKEKDAWKQAAVKKYLSLKEQNTANEEPADVIFDKTANNK